MPISDTRGSVLGTAIRALIDKWTAEADQRSKLASFAGGLSTRQGYLVAAGVFRMCADDLSAALTAQSEGQKVDTRVESKADAVDSHDVNR